jgi:hypothetical protein
MDLDNRIASAMAALHDARRAADYSPNVDNILLARMAERALNELLDAKLEQRALVG